MNIPFSIQNPLQVAHPGYYVQGGVPFPDGKVEGPDSLFVVDESGQECAASILPSAWWPNGSMKWALIGMIVPLSPDTSNNYILRGRRTDNPNKPAPFADQTHERIRVDTGSIRFEVDRTRPNLFRVFDLYGTDTSSSAPVLDRDTGSGLFAEIEKRDAANRLIALDANSDASCFSAELELADRVRAVILLRGIHSSPNGERFAPYILRIYAYRNSGMLRFVHSFIHDGEPETDFLKSIGIRFSIGPGDITEYTFGRDKGEGVRTQRHPRTDGPIWRYGELRQDSCLHYAVSKGVNPGKNSLLKVCDGVRSQGWASILTDRFRLSMGIRNFWQEYPKAIEIDCENRELRACFYSGGNRSLDLRRYSDKLYGGLYEAPCSPDAKPQPFDHGRCNARYIAKTSEMFLDVAPANATDVSPAVNALLFQRPPLLRPDMEWIASTRVFGDYAVSHLESPSEIYLKQCMDFMMDEQEYRRWYSFIDYGDVMHSFDPERDMWRFDEGGFAWTNNESQFCEGAWAAYLCTGNERIYRFAEAMTRHLSDIDMYHDGPLAGCGMRHNVNHWGCTNRERRLTIPANKRIYYFLSGDERIRDLVRFSYDRLCDTPERHGAMDVGVGGTALLFLWETTGDKRYGDILKKLTETFCARAISGHAFPEFLDIDFKTGNGSIPEDMSPLFGFFLMDFGPMQTLLDSVELTGSTGVRNAILKWAELLIMPIDQSSRLQPRLQVGKLGHITNMRTAAFAWRMTGNDRYLDYVKEGLKTELYTFEQKGGAGILEEEPHMTVRNNLEPSEKLALYAQLQCGHLNDGKTGYAKGESGHALFIGRTLANIPFGLFCSSRTQEANLTT